MEDFEMIITNNTIATPAATKSLVEQKTGTADAGKQEGEVFVKSQPDSNLPQKINLLKFISTQSISDKTKEKELFFQTLQNELSGMLGGMLIEWESAYVGKPSFNYIVDREGDKYAAIAAREVQQNKINVLGLFANPDTTKMILINMQSKLKPGTTPANYEFTDPEFQKFYKALHNATSNTSNYETPGRLVRVGWGEGDHVNVNSDHTPAGSNTVSWKMATQVTEAIFAPVPATA